jgi:Transposase DDE domain
VSWYNRVLSAINAGAPFLVPTQATNLALLVSAILKKRTLRLSELARAYPTPQERRVEAPKHDLLHRLKRLWRFTDNERVDALEVQMAFVPHVVARLGHPRLLGLAIDWTFFDTALPSGEGMRYQILRIAVPRKGRALPLLQLAYDRDRLPAQKSQNQLEQEALLAVLRALPSGVRPVVLADRGFRRAGFIRWLQHHGVDYVVRLSKGSCITETDGEQWKLGEEGLQRGQLLWVRGVECVRDHRPSVEHRWRAGAVAARRHRADADHRWHPRGPGFPDAGSGRGRRVHHRAHRRRAYRPGGTPRVDR